MRPHEIFHSTGDNFRSRTDIVLVRPEFGGNVGSVLRAVSNMGISGNIYIVGSPASICDAECVKMARHAAKRISEIRFVPSLKDTGGVGTLRLASTARVASPSRPHPLPVRDSIEKAIGMLAGDPDLRVQLVFGCESDGLSNEDVAFCDWVVTIPSSSEYSSLNLAQAVLIFVYEMNVALTREAAKEISQKSQRGRLIEHFVRMAESVGFVLPGDPYKMKPRLESILSVLPPHVEGAETLHGLLEQIVRSVQKGEIDLKGRYRKRVEELVKEQ